jgi:hypothetical protein
VNKPFPGIDVPLLATNPQTGQPTVLMAQTWIEYFQGRTSGNYVQGLIPSGSAVGITSGVAKTITSLTLPSGDWDIDCHLYFVPAATTSMTFIAGSISQVTNTLDLTPGNFGILPMAAVVSGGLVFSVTIPSTKFAGGQTLFLVAQAVFTVSTCSAYGVIQARRQD